MKSVNFDRCLLLESVFSRGSGLRPILIAAAFCLLSNLTGCDGSVTTPPVELTPPPRLSDQPEPTINRIMTDTPTTTPTLEPASFRVIAYVTPNIVVDLIPYEQLTHINYAFLLPNPDGSFAPLRNGSKLKEIVTNAHSAGVSVLISVGGWGWESEFEQMAADPVSRAAFVANLTALVDEYSLDGADVDWEYPHPGESAQNYLLLMQELKVAMPNKLLTTAVVSHGANGDGVPTASFELFDFVNVMTYDGPDHGTMTQFEVGMTYWQERGLAADKMVMGIPFYSRPGELLYRDIISADPAAANTDQITVNGVENRYNGVLTVQKKTALALEKAGGVMFWTLDYDASGELSLLTAIDEVVQQQE